MVTRSKYSVLGTNYLEERINTNAHYIAKQATQILGECLKSNSNQRLYPRNRPGHMRRHSQKTSVHNHYRGLQRTFDDKTLQGLGKALSQELEVNPEALAMVKQKCVDYAKKRGLPTDTELTPPR